MKTRIQILACLTCLSSVDYQAHSQGYIVPKGVSIGGYENGFGYRVSVVDNPSGANSVWSTNTQFWLNPIGTTQPTTYTNTFIFSELADVGVRAFLVSSNDSISLQPILSQSWTELADSSTHVFQSGVPFYVGLYSGFNFAPPYPPNPPYQYLDPVFGWVLLVNNQGVIQMLGGALEYGGAGIYAGTQTVIPTPEPNTLALSALGGALVVWRRWKSRTI